MAKRVTDSERQRIIDAFATGKSCRQIAKEFKRSPGTISLIAQDVGHEFGRLNLIRAQEKLMAYTAERRAELKVSHVEAVERMVRQLFEPCLVYNFGGKDNTYNEHMLDEPTFRDKRDLTQAIRNMMTTVLEMDRREQETIDDGVFDRLFSMIDDEAREYSDAHGA